MNSTATKIEVSRLTRSFRLDDTTVTALDDVNLQVAAGEFCCMVGPSGCGKTTLLRLIAGLDRPTAGDLRIAGSDEGRPPNAMVFQEQSVFPWMTVEQNVGYGLRMRREKPHLIRERVAHFLRMVGLHDFARAYPHQLSGGMKQRVSVARAFATDPEVLLMDEPFAALDEQSKLLLQNELLRIWDETQKTVVYITHSIDEAVALGDRVVVLTSRPGRIKTSIDIDLPRPRVVYDLKSDARFTELTTRVWNELKDEVLAVFHATRGLS